MQMVLAQLCIDSIIFTRKINHSSNVRGIHSRRWYTWVSFSLPFLCYSKVKAWLGLTRVKDQFNLIWSWKAHCLQVVYSHKWKRWVESHSTLIVPMQGSITNTHQTKPWLDFFSLPQQRMHGLRCHFWHEPIIFLSYCSFHCSAVVSLLFASVMWKSISVRHCERCLNS